MPKGIRYGGRTKGTPNRRSADLHEMIGKCGLNGKDGMHPLELLLYVVNDNTEALGYEDILRQECGDDEKELAKLTKLKKKIKRLHFPLHMRMEAAKDALPYLEAKRKALEVDGDGDTGCTFVIYGPGGEVSRG